MKKLSPKHWNEKTAAHLLNRAGFGGRPQDVKRLATMSLDDAVARFIDFPAGEDTFDPPTWVQPGIESRENYRKMKGLPEEERRKIRQQQNRLNNFRMFELRAWWLYRMRYDEFPLREKMTLFLHGHFATGQNKVKQAYPHYLQNKLFRSHAGGNWRTLVEDVSKDPAMLMYLDNARSNRKKPNENYAREVMELFTLGEGNYDESDIRDAARAFTGWSISRGQFAFEWKPKIHDPGEKTILGQTGLWKGDDVVRILLEQPQAAEFLAWKLIRFFVSDAPDPEFQLALTEKIREEDFELKPVLRSLFESQRFYDSKHIRSQIKSPVQWMIGILHQLDAHMPPPRRSAHMLDMLGQKLFHPPNVKGWDGGFAWITAASLVNRYNFAGQLIQLSANWKELKRYRARAGAMMDALSMDPMSMTSDSMMDAVDAVDRKKAPPEAPSKNDALEKEEWPYGSGPGKLVDVNRVLPKSERRSVEQVKERLASRLYQNELRPEDEKHLD